METSTTLTRPTRNSEPKPRYDGKKMSLEKFMDFNAEDGFKYEWNNGILESTLYKMKPSELLLVMRLQNNFRNTVAGKEGGMLAAETKIFFESLNRGRIPDLSFFTKEQLLRANAGGNPIPTFVIELVSPTDKLSYYDTKLDEYFSVGVTAVWLIDKAKKRVWIFTSPKDVKICTDDDICSAAPAVPDFTITPKQLFS